MSQAGINGAGGLPSVATTYVTDVNSPAIPALNILNVPGGVTTSNNVNGIRTDGSSGSNTLTVQLTNRIQGTSTTIGSVNADPITFSLGATPGAYHFELSVVAFDSVTPTASSYFDVATARTTGAAASLAGVPDETVVEDAALGASDVDFVASGNNIIIRVLGVAGLTLNWRALLTYTFVS